MRRVLRAGAEIKHGQKLRAGVDGQPEHLSGAAQPGAQFIQLQMRELEMAKEAFVQGLCMFESREPERLVMVACR
jgi:hypothetical protein